MLFNINRKILIKQGIIGTLQCKKKQFFLHEYGKVIKLVGERQREDELSRLKTKVNLLLDVKEKMQAENQRLKKMVEEYKVAESDPLLPAPVYEGRDELYMRMVLVFMKSLKRENKWLEFKNKTANAKEYYRIDKVDFDRIMVGIVSQTTEDLEEKALIKVMINVGILKCVDGRELFPVVSGDFPRKAYLVKKSAIDMIDVECSYEW